MPQYQILKQFMEGLDQQGKVQAEYIWVGGSGEDIRCKTKTLPKKVDSVDQLPDWNFDGSSTGQARGHFSEIVIKPRAIFRDPFRRGDNILVICDTYKPDGTPLPGNYRKKAKEIFDQCLNEKPWFGLEQEYTLFTPKGRPLGWPEVGFPGPQGPYYCSVGTDNAFGRDVVEAHYRACLYAGVNISGINAEVMPGQWEYQVGPCEGIDCGDHMWMSRYLLHRVSELFDVVASFDPKPIPGDWNGAGCHVNFSTECMRKEGGIKHINEAVEKLSKKHDEHVAVYGKGNERRLTGAHETASIDEFTSGVANRGASIRIGNDTQKKGFGYFEDRRPSSNCDPYLVSSKMVETVCLETN